MEVPNWNDEKVYVRKLVQLKNIPLSRSFQRLFFTITRMLTLAYVKLEMVVGKIEMLESFLLAKFFPAKNFPTLRSFQLNISQNDAFESILKPVHKPERTSG